MKERGAGRILLFLAIAIGGTGLDLWSKDRLFAELGPPGAYRAPDNLESVRWIWPDFFGLQTALNQGALFGMGQGKVWLFATLSIGATLARSGESVSEMTARADAAMYQAKESGRNTVITV